MTIAAGIIIGFTGELNAIPAGWTRELTLDNRYPQGSDADQAPGTAGGTTTHTHTSPGHSHTMPSHSHAFTTDEAGRENGRADGKNRARSDHTHSGTSGAIGGTVASTAAGWQSTFSDPAHYEVVWIRSAGTSQEVPVKGLLLWNVGQAPTNYRQHAGSAGRFLKGARSGFAAGRTSGGPHSHAGAPHSHTISDHTHPSVTTGNGSRGRRVEGYVSSNRSGRDHTHSASFSATPSPTSEDSPATTGSANSPRTGVTTYEPPYHMLQAIEPSGESSVALPPGGIAAWLGSLADIPIGWMKCDGSNGTPDLRGRFVKAASVAADVGTRGGSKGHGHMNPTSHTHSASHTHSISTGASSAQHRSKGERGGNESISSGTHTHGGTTDASDPGTSSAVQGVEDNPDTRPQYRTVAWVMASDAALGAGLLGM